MRQTFQKPEVQRPIEVLIQDAEHLDTGTSGLSVRGEPLGFKVWCPQLPGGHLFFHKDYRQLLPRDLRVFPDLFRWSMEVLNGSPELLILMATDEGRFVEAATKAIPTDILQIISPYQAEIGAFGTFDYKHLKSAAEENGVPMSEYLRKVFPVLQEVNEQRMIYAPVRNLRTGGKTKVKVPNVQPQVLQSIHNGFHTGNEYAARNILMDNLDAHKIEKGSLEELMGNVEAWPERGIGNLVNGEAIVVSLDSEAHNKKYADVLDDPFNKVAMVRDLSPLDLAGVKAVTIINRYSSLARVIDPELHPHLAELGFVVPNKRTQLNGKPVIAEGICMVTYSTGFETSENASYDTWAAMLASAQLALRRVLGSNGYENSSYVIGINRGAPSTLKEAHIQTYVLRHLDLGSHEDAFRPTQENELYRDAGIRIFAEPKCGQGRIRFPPDIDYRGRIDFTARSPNEFFDLGHAIRYHSQVLNAMNIRDWVVFSKGGDFFARTLSPEEREARIGFFESATNTRISSSTTIPRVAIGKGEGNQEEFAGAYRGILKDFLYGRRK